MAGHRPLLMYVDDDPDLSAVVADVLELEGFDVVPARHGAHALALLDGGLAPQIIVCDMMMPQLDGFGFLAAYRRRPGARAPVLAVSAFETYVERAVAAGATAALRKPFELDGFVDAVRALEHADPPAGPGKASSEAETERARVEAVLALALDGAPSTSWDAFTGRVARLFDAPVCLVSIVDAERQRWGGACGLPGPLAAAGGSARADSFCTHAVAARAALVVQDANENPFFAGNRLVREHGFRFYAGVPILDRRGHALGTLCLLDHAPRRFTGFDLALLAALARRIAGELEQREQHRSGGAPDAAFRNLEAWDPELDVLGRETFEEAARLQALRAAERRWPLALAAVRLPPDARPFLEALKRALPVAHLGRLGRDVLGVAAPRTAPGTLEADIRRAGGAWGPPVVTAAAVRTTDAARVMAELERSVERTAGA